MLLMDTKAQLSSKSETGPNPHQGKAMLGCLITKICSGGKFNTVHWTVKICFTIDILYFSDSALGQSLEGDINHQSCKKANISFNVCQGKTTQQVRVFVVKPGKTQFNLWAPFGRGREPTSTFSAL